MECGPAWLRSAQTLPDVSRDRGFSTEMPTLQGQLQMGQLGAVVTCISCLCSALQIAILALNFNRKVK